MSLSRDRNFQLDLNGQTAIFIPNCSFLLFYDKSKSTLQALLIHAVFTLFILQV